MNGSARLPIVNTCGCIDKDQTFSKTKVRKSDTIPEEKIEKIAKIKWNNDALGAIGYFGTLYDTDSKKIAFVKTALTKDQAFARVKSKPDLDKEKLSKAAEDLFFRSQKGMENEKRFFKQHPVQVPFKATEISDQILDSYDLIVDDSLSKEAASYPFEHIRQCWIIEELGDTDLFIHAARGKNTRITVDYTYQLCRILDFLEKTNICHHDLKPENILCFGDQLKVIDFGNWLPIQQRTTHDNYSTEAVSTLNYAAPEGIIAAVLQTPWNCHKMDVWSVGFIVLFLLYNRDVFEVYQVQSLINDLGVCQYHLIVPRLNDLMTNAVSKLMHIITNGINEESKTHYQTHRETRLKLLAFTQGMLTVDINKRLSGQQTLTEFRKRMC